MEETPIPPPIRKPEIQYTKIFINNEFVNSISGKTFPTFNPVTGEKIAEVQQGDKDDVDKAVKAARAAFRRGSSWRVMSPSERRDMLNKLCDLVERDAVYLSSLETLDNGKPYKDALLVSIPGTVNAMRFNAGIPDKLFGQVFPSPEGSFCYTRHEPVGVCGLIVPWNYPIDLFLVKVTTALACGCVCVVKPAEQTPLTALYLASLIKEAGFPPGVVNVVPGFGQTAGAAISAHNDVNKISFTGSTEVGQMIMAAAAKSNLKRLTLELGGKSPLIVLPDADLAVAVEAAHLGVYANMGQCCTAASRMFVHEDIYEQFVDMCIERAKKTKIGDPFDLSTDAGPQIDEVQFKKILELIESGKDSGATLRLGGARHGDSGLFIQNTVFTDVTPDMRIAQEEIFGPVMCVFKFKSTEEVIDAANDSKYGLAAAVMTRDIDKYMYIANSLEAGTVWINQYDVVNHSAPFGGFKMSGIGRELGYHGISQYTEIKTVLVKHFKPKD